jgi:hypothetical protein
MYLIPFRLEYSLRTRECCIGYRLRCKIWSGKPLFLKKLAHAKVSCYDHP